MAETKMNYIKYDHILKQDVASYSDWETALKCCYGNPRYSIRQEVI